MLTLGEIERNQCYAKGLSDESKVIEWFKSREYRVLPSTLDENKWQDIDVWINGKGVSIKSQHKGVSFQNIGFELCNQLTTKSNCKISEEVLETSDLNERHVFALLESGSWEPGWFKTGLADVYIFYQGDEMRIYTKRAICEHIENYKFLRIRQLTPETKRYLGGTYRHCNTVCGYLHWDSVPHKTYKIEA
jgi:hypothetical protein